MSAIVFDLDGTLAPVGKPIPDSLADGLRELELRGHTVAVCSGKPLAYLCGMLRQIGLKRPVLVGENGAAMQVGIDLPPVIRGRLPYPKGVDSALRRIKEAIDGRYDGQVWYQPNEHMLTCFPHSEDLFDPIGRLIEDSGASEAGLIVYRHCDCFDIIPAGVNKGAGLMEMCRVLGIDPADTVAVGDHDNDRPMFLAAGLSIGVGPSSPAEAKLHFENAEQAVEYILAL